MIKLHVTEYKDSLNHLSHLEIPIDSNIQYAIKHLLKISVPSPIHVPHKICLGLEIIPLNQMKLRLPSLSVNESVARATVAAFCAQADPLAAELADIKCVVSEAVTNCIVHAYRDTVGDIYITVTIYESGALKIEIMDKGVGIEDIARARQPLYTTDAANERSGMGFTVMESFCDKVRVFSGCKKGTVVTLFKYLKIKE